MKLAALLASFLAVGAWVKDQVKPATLVPETGIAASVSDDVSVMKSCTHNSDCKFGGCSGGRCGSCSNNSDCKGFGGCSGGWCGSCSNNSDCKGFGDCSGGKCTKPPAQ